MIMVLGKYIIAIEYLIQAGAKLNRDGKSHAWKLNLMAKKIEIYAILIKNIDNQSLKNTCQK